MAERVEEAVGEGEGVGRPAGPLLLGGQVLWDAPW